MNIKELPRVLFEELSEEIGQGKKKDITTDETDDSYLIQELEPEVNFSGAIGLREDERFDSHAFALWFGVPRNEDDVLLSKPPIAIEAGPKRLGEWSRGQGQRLEDGATLSVENLALSSEMFNLIPKILERASELASEAESEMYWEADVHPGDYKKPSDVY